MLPGMLGSSSPAATVDAPESVVICEGRPPAPNSPVGGRRLLVAPSVSEAVNADFLCVSRRLERLSAALRMLAVLGLVLLLDSDCGRCFGSRLRLKTEGFLVTTLGKVFSDSS